MLKSKVAEVFIDRIAPLEEMVELRAMGCGVRGFPPDAEDEDHGRYGQQDARYGDVDITHWILGLLRGGHDRADQVRFSGRRQARERRAAASVAPAPKSGR